MADITDLFPDGVPPRPTLPRPVSAEVRTFRGRVYHRDRGCTCPDDDARRDPDRCCARCSWGAFQCAVCWGAEGEVPTDCPGRPMTDEECSGVMAGTIDYIQARGGWVRGRYVAGRFRCE